MDTGDYIVVVNARNIHLTGRKRADKRYYRHSGYPGGIKERSFEEQRAQDARKVIEHAVRGMLPRGPLGRAMFRKLKVYNGPEHRHEAQQPRPLEL